MSWLHPTGVPGRQADWSMNLLNDIWDHPVDPDYEAAAEAEPGGGGQRVGWAAAAIMVLAGALLAWSGVAATKAAPAAEVQRQELVARVREAEAAQDLLRAKVAALSTQVRELQVAALGGGPSAAALDSLEMAASLRPVLGPGVVVVVDDADTTTSTNDTRVLDIDLRELVNGLWEAGAEAIAVNGHRLSAMTSIRNAGAAITVDYRSLTRPYRVEAIGDPRTIQARFAATAGGTWWQSLQSNYRIQIQISRAEELRLEADPGAVLRQASVP